MRDVHFYVVTPENYEEFRKTYGDGPFVAMSVDGYENLSLNLADLQRYVRQQNAVIIFYEKAVAK